MDDLDSAFATAPPRPPLVTPQEARADVVAAFGIASRLGRLTGFAPDRATPEERAEVVDLRRAMVEVRDAMDSHVARIDAAFRLAARESGAREFTTDAGTVAVVPGPAQYRTQEEALRKALLELVPDVLERHEVDEAVVTTVTLKANHTRLNALAAKRGDRVRLAIERHRVRLEPSALAASVRYPVAR